MNDPDPEPAPQQSRPRVKVCGPPTMPTGTYVTPAPPQRSLSLDRRLARPSTRPRRRIVPAALRLHPRAGSLAPVAATPWRQPLFPPAHLLSDEGPHVRPRARGFRSKTQPNRFNRLGRAPHRRDRTTSERSRGGSRAREKCEATVRAALSPPPGSPGRVQLGRDSLVPFRLRPHPRLDRRWLRRRRAPPRGSDGPDHRHPAGSQGYRA